MALTETNLGGLTTQPVVGGVTFPTLKGTALPDASSGMSQSQNDALALLSSELQGWGFGQDAIDWATNMIQSNYSTDQILNSLRDQPFYQNSIFGQVNKTRQANNLPVMTEAQILAYKDQAMSDAQQSGLPQGFFTDAELTKLMGSDVSPAELDQRILQGFDKANQASPEVKAALQNYYGVDTAGLAAYYLDPTRSLSLLQKQLQAAQIGGQATIAGFQGLGQSAAEQLASQGISQDQARTGFQHLTTEAQLFNPLPGSNESTIDQQIQLGAEFGGNGGDQQQITQREEERKAQFAGGYRFDQNAKGMTGLGPARSNG